MDEESVKPDLFPSRKALVITMVNPNCPLGGSSNLMRNFLTSFNKKSYTIISTPPRRQERDEKLPVLKFITDVYKHRRPLQKVLHAYWLKKDVRRIQDFIDEFNPEYILLSYPHLYNCRVFMELNLPDECKVVGYFHDTFIEGQTGKVKETILNIYHDRLLKSIDLLFVMNEGMRELYLNNFGRQTVALEHTFPEYNTYSSLFSLDSKISRNSFFWGGNVLGYNTSSLSRLIRLGKNNGFSTRITSRQSLKNLISILGSNNIEHEFYSAREDYIQALATNSFLLLALDWPNETTYHKDEIGTIFSTKAIEYMMAGVPIILHAPKEYFMSKFFIKNKCGYVISSRNKSLMQEQFLSLIGKDHSKVVANAIKTAELFSISSVHQKWFNGVNSSL